MNPENPGAGAEPGLDPEVENPTEYRVEDRRHWTRDESEIGQETRNERPTVLDEYKLRAERAEERLHEYIAAFKSREQDQDAFRERLARDVDRRVELRFASLVGDMVELVDDLDLALRHGESGNAPAPLIEGIRMARGRFLAALEKHGVVHVDPLGEEFDPVQYEAIRVDSVREPERNNRVTEVHRLGYRLGERVIRPARVAVGRWTDS